MAGETTDPRLPFQLLVSELKLIIVQVRVCSLSEANYEVFTLLEGD